MHTVMRIGVPEDQVGRITGTHMEIHILDGKKQEK